VVKGVTSELQTRQIALIHKRLASVQKNDHLSQRMYSKTSSVHHDADQLQPNAVIAPILEDCRRVMDSWGASGTFDPFNKIYEVCLCQFNDVKRRPSVNM
jgi:hypothetical protein